MSPHLSRQRAEEYRQRLLPPAELLAVDDHLTICEGCRQRAGANIEIEAVVSDFHRRLLLDAAAPTDHPSYEQLAKLVDDEPNRHERAELEIHLEVCTYCTAEANDLRALRAELQALSVEKTSRELQPGFGEKIRSLIDLRRVSFRPAFAATLALILIAASVALFFAWRASTRSQPVHQATTPVPEISPDANSPSIATGPSPSQESKPDEPEVTLNDGGRRVTIDVSGNVEGLDPLTGASSNVVRRALTTGRVALPDLSELIGVNGRLMGTSDSSAFSLMEPVGKVSRNTRPTFRWRPLTGATSYTVAVLDASYNLVTTSPPLTTTSWTPTVQLARGRVYSWQVTSLKDGKQQLSPAPPEPEARFRVLDRATVDELMSIEKASKSHLVRGSMYARAGLLDDAEKELRALVDANPDSRLARNLLQSVRAKRRQ